MLQYNICILQMQGVIFRLRKVSRFLKNLRVYLLKRQGAIHGGTLTPHTKWCREFLPITGQNTKIEDLKVSRSGYIYKGINFRF